MGMITPAGGVAALALLFVMIGLAGPMSVMETAIGDIEYGIKEVKMPSAFGGDKDLWDQENPNETQEKMINTSKAGFAFCFLGMLLSLAFLAACFTDKIPVSAWILGVAMTLMYVIGVACATQYPYIDQNDAMLDKMKVGWGAGLLWTSLVFNIIATGLGFVGKDEASAKPADAGTAGEV